MGIGIIGFFIGVTIIFIIIVFYTISIYKKCPQGKILVTYNQIGKEKTYKPITKGGIFVFPIIQDYQYLDLAPIAFDINKNVLIWDNTKLNVSVTVTVGISTEPSIMENAVERLLGLSQQDIQDMAKDIITGQVRLIFAQTKFEKIRTNIVNINSMISENANHEVNKIGLQLINFNITRISDENSRTLI